MIACRPDPLAVMLLAVLFYMLGYLPDLHALLYEPLTGSRLFDMTRRILTGGFFNLFAGSRILVYK